MTVDLRLAARRLARAPGFTLAAVAVLALGIGASTSVYSIVDAVLLAPLPYPEPERLVRLWETNPREGIVRSDVSPGTFADWRARSSSFAALATFVVREWALTGDGAAEHVRGAEVSPALLPMLGASPETGRLFRPEAEQGAFADQEVLISHGLWLRRFGGAAGVVGRELRFEGRDRGATIVGILPASFDFPPGTAVWRPAVLNEPIGPGFRATRWHEAIGRLAPGVTLERARADLERISARLASEYPQSNAGWSVAVAPLHDAITGAIRPALVALFGAVSCMLLVGCANVANLFLVRFGSARSELAVRAALGATRRRLVTQGLAESLLVALAGGAVGVLLASWLTGVLVAAAPVEVPRLTGAGLHARVLGFALALVAGTTLVAGLVPIVRASGGELHGWLQAGARAADGGTSGWRRLVLAGQVALTVVLLAGAGLLTRTFSHLQQTDLGFEPAGVAGVTVDLPIFKFPERRPWFRLAVFHRDLVDRLGELPGVDAAAGSTQLPLDGPPVLDFGWATTATAAEGFRRPESATARTAMAHHVVTPGYFRVLGIPLVRGRTFTGDDAWSERALTDPGGPPDPAVAIVDETLARQLWPGEDPIGKRLVTESYRKVMTVVGVVGAVRDTGAAGPITPALYEPVAQTPPVGLTVVLRTRGDAGELAARAAAAARAVDPDLMIDRAEALDGLVRRTLAAPRFTMTLAAAFALAALALAALGIFGVMAFAVGRRTREMGIRLALGADRGDVVRLVVIEGLRPVVIGLALGGVASLGLSRLAGSLVVGISPRDPVSLTVAPLLLLASAVLACYVPARRASRVDPVTALRTE